TVSGTLVVTESAVTEVELAFTRPLDASREPAVLTPAYARIAPVALCLLPNPHAKLAGSEPCATRRYTAWRSAVPFVSTRTRLQPDGGVIDGVPRTPTTASSTSPATTPLGRETESELTALPSADDDPRNAMPRCPDVAAR